MTKLTGRRRNIVRAITYVGKWTLEDAQRQWGTRTMEILIERGYFTVATVEPATVYPTGAAVDETWDDRITSNRQMADLMGIWNGDKPRKGWHH